MVPAGTLLSDQANPEPMLALEAQSCSLRAPWMALVPSTVVLVAESVS